MIDRAVAIAGFLAHHGWSEAQQNPFDGDFSSRRYARLTQTDGRHAILMDADPDQKTHAFVMLAKLLHKLEISAPKILAADPAHGLVLMEDLGTQNFGLLLDKGEDKTSLYLKATDVLVHLHHHFEPAQGQSLDLPVFGGALFASQVELFLDVYFPHIKGREANLEESESFRAAWKNVLHGIEALPQSLLLRDFMPDNLMQVMGREGWRSVGVLDFQDAGIGPIAYDLASLCEVVRRDGGDGMQQIVLEHYHKKAQPKLALKTLEDACMVLAAQRHMRILGILVRMAQKTGRRDRLVYMPRIWTYMDQLLKHAPLRPVQSWLIDMGLLARKER